MLRDPDGHNWRKTRYLEFLMEQEQDRSSWIHDSRPFLIDGEGMNLREAAEYAQQLEREQLVTCQQVMGVVAARLTQSGRDLVTAARTQREDQLLRARYARRAVLACAHDLGVRGQALDPSGVIDCHHGRFLGEMLTGAEVARATVYLVEWGLLTELGPRTANGLPHLVELTAKGQDCMDDHDGDVTAYLRPQTPPAAGQVFNTHFGSNSGPVAIGSSNFTQYVSGGIDPAQLRELVTYTRGELPKFGLYEAEAREVVAELEAQAESARPDPERQKTLVRRLGTMVETVGAPLLLAWLKSQPWWPDKK